MIVSTSDASLTDALEELPVPGREVVEHPHRFAAGHESRDQVGADEPGSAGDEVPRAGQSAESLAAPDVFHDPRVLDFPGASAFFHVLQLASHFAL